jgi:quercetin dioxygenase-like cupin family protein
MEDYKIIFDALDWQAPLPGFRSKAVITGQKQMRLVEFTSAFVEPQWCHRGHWGLVLQGALEIDFNGQIVRYPQGAGIAIPTGPAHGHKARAVTPRVLLFLIEDV